MRGPLVAHAGRWIAIYIDTDVVWFRLRNDLGLWIGRTPKLFSERNGYVKSLPLGFGWRAKVLS